VQRSGKNGEFGEKDWLWPGIIHTAGLIGGVERGKSKRGREGRGGGSQRPVKGTTLGGQYEEKGGARL